MKNKNEIIIQCWTGKTLFQGNYKDKKVDKVLEANRCKCDVCENHRKNNDNESEYCKSSGHSGYAGDFSISWVNTENKGNVYEFINY